MWGPVDLLVAMSRMQLRLAGCTPREIDAPRGPLTVYEGGDGDRDDAVVLIHGMGHQAGSWAPAIRPLADRHRVLVPDLPGHGKSAPQDGPLALADELEGLKALLDDPRAPERVTLVGNSMGGWVALLYARAHPERVQRVISENGGGLAFELDGVTLTPDTPEEMKKALQAIGSPVPGGWFLRDLVRSIQEGPAPRLMAGDDSALLLDGRLGEVQVPVDLVWGVEDRILPLEYAQRLAQGLPDARLHRLEGCGHIPHQQCPGSFVETLLSLLDGAPRPRETSP